MNVPRDAAIAATGAHVVHGERLPEAFAVATDTRTLQPGDVFVALRGERFDGAAFVAEALARGALAVLVDRLAALPDNVPALVVDDVRAAYLALGGEARRLARARVVAITGSAGKTTTKEFVAQLFGAERGLRVLATPANENNEIGVAKFLLSLTPETDIAVVELGARHFGEIEPLARAARPDVAVLTNLGDAHLEIMGSPERLDATKWGIFASGAQPVLNARDPRQRARAAGLARAPQAFAATDAATPLEPFGTRTTVLCGRDALVLLEGGRSQTLPVRCEVAGEHNRANVAAAAAAVLAFGGDGVAVAARVGELRLPSGRYERRTIGDLELIYDAYNASMSGALATLDAFARERSPRRIAVLGSMAELGDNAPAMHERVGVAAAHAGLAALLVGGDFAADLARGARAGGLPGERVVRFDANAEAARWLRANARPGDLVLLKGSRRYRLEEIAEELAAHAR